MNTRSAFFALLFCSLPLAAASSPAIDSLPGVSPEVPAPALPDRPQPADWTVMYFINSRNNLESSGLMDMNQLELAGSTSRVKITAELGRISGYDDADGDWTGVRRYLVEKDADTSRINSTVLQDLGKADMGSWKELVSFLNWSKTNFPARRYALVLWDHGNGWKPVNPANSYFFYDKGFSFDDTTANEFSIPQIARALKAVGGVDFLMLDGCNMAMASVAYELKDSAAALTASEEMEPGVVVRYVQFLGMLNAGPSMGPEEFAANTVRTYGDYFTGAAGDNEEMQVTQSALRTAKLGPFREKLDAWASAAIKEDRALLLKAAAASRIYGEDPDYRDLCHFVLLVTAATADATSRVGSARRLSTDRS